MQLESKVRKVGNSFVMTIPAQVVRDLRLKKDQKMMIDYHGDTITIKKA